MKAFSGATVDDIEDIVRPIARKLPDKVILHVSTNDLKNFPPKIIANSIVNLTKQIEEDSPTTTVGVSALYSPEWLHKIRYKC